MVYNKFVSLAIAVLITHCNSLVLELMEAEVAVKCRILLILVLLYCMWIIRFWLRMIR